ncbi:hypothetical protein BDA99DRAFT_562804 [Phascolomyces articulosus]|uniref:Uncharacterized protein n=1 Tax=Phascolomyces articulosus TaxID=60185 RepID=A0AAD5PCD7_9FUNG|nr:hypothetical protein BDA99DRAFT_562804 [Phascolomyces articulosus]
MSMLKDHNIVTQDTASSFWNSTNNTKRDSYHNINTSETENRSIVAITGHQQSSINEDGMTSKSQHNDIGSSSSNTTQPEELSLYQIQIELAKQKEMSEILQNNNQMMKIQYDELHRRQQLMEVVLKAYYLDDEVFQALNNAYETNNNWGVKDSNQDNVTTIDMDHNATEESSDKTLSSWVTNVFHRSFRRRRQQCRQQQNLDRNSEATPFAKDI